MSHNSARIAILALLALMIFPAYSEEFQGTTYRLDPQHVEVALPVNASSLTLTLQDKAKDLSLVDLEGKSIGLNYSYTFWQGDYTYSLTFDKKTLGYLTYTLPSQGQQFFLSMRNSVPIRVVIPPGYATGDRILGIARPDPDQISPSSNGTVLTWSNPTPGLFIEVSYYKASAPEALKRTFLILLGAGLVLFIEYRRSIRRLRSMAEDVERRA